MKTAIIVPTINVPNLLVDYANNFLSYKHNDVEFIIIGDLKSPDKKCEKVAHTLRKMGFDAMYFDIKKQDKWIKNYYLLSTLVSYNTDARRCIGYLIAKQHGAKIIISIDDDNFVTQEDFLKHHSIVGKKQEAQAVTSSDGWFNPCSMLTGMPVSPSYILNMERIYSRGFPFSKRLNDRIITYEKRKSKVLLNLGMWIGTPDVDAVTNLSEVTISNGLKEHGKLIIPPETMCPLNTQNTAFHISMLPSMYYFNNIGRYGDVWLGYFTKKCIDAMGGCLMIGEPLTDHRRNTHNYMKDLKNELMGMILTDKLVEILPNMNINSRKCTEVYIEISNILSEQNITLLSKMSEQMRTWVDVCEIV